jgi:hypothetical protein
LDVVAARLFELRLSLEIWVPAFAGTTPYY